MSTTPTDPPEIARLMQTHGDLFDKHFSHKLDEQSAVLKAHLLIEESSVTSTTAQFRTQSICGEYGSPFSK